MRNERPGADAAKRERIKAYGEVFTPPETVKAMCDMLEEQDPDAFLPGKTFLEPTCGDGAFVAEILRRKFDHCRRRGDYTAALDSVYAMELLADNVEKTIERVKALCRERFPLTRAEEAMIEDHVIQADALKVMKLLARYEPPAICRREGDDDQP